MHRNVSTTTTNNNNRTQQHHLQVTRHYKGRVKRRQQQHIKYTKQKQQAPILHQNAQ